MDQALNRTRMLWLSGWNMPAEVFQPLQIRLTNYNHKSLDYSHCHHADEMLDTVYSLVHETKRGVQQNEPHSKLLLAGWSLGGLLAMKTAASINVGGLVLISSNAQFTRPITRSRQDRCLGWPDLYVKRMINALSVDQEKVAQNFREMLFSDTEQLSEYLRPLPHYPSWSMEAMEAGLQVLRNETSLAELGSIDCPVLLIHGTADQICPYHAALEIEMNTRRASLMTLESAGHIPFWGRETIVADRVREWWDEQ